MINIIFELCSLIFTLNLNVFYPERTIENNFNSNQNVIQEEETIHSTYTNETCSTAISLSPNEYYNYEEYTTTVNGSILSRYLDTDVYYFSLLTECNINLNITINSSSQWSIDVGLFELIYYETDNENEFFNTFDTVYNNTNSNSIFNVHYKQFNSTLRAGTYYLKLNQQSGSEDEENINYSFTLTVERCDSVKNYQINDLKYNKNLSGALWIADYVPFDDFPMFDINKTISFFNGNDPVPDYTLLNLYDSSQERYLLAGKFYIWDIDTIKFIHHCVESVKNNLNEKYSDYDEIIYNIEFAHDLTDYIGSFWVKINTIVDGVVQSQTVELAINALDFCIENVMLPLAHQIIDMYIPKDYETVEIQKEALQTLLNVTLNWGFETLIIPIYYNIIREGNPLIPATCNYKVSYFCTYEYLEDATEFSYEDEYIYEFLNENGYDMNGTFYGIVRSDDTESLNQLQTIDSYSDVFREPEQLIDQSKSLEAILEGDYKWLKFTADESKKYYFIFQNDNFHQVDIFYDIVAGYSNNNILCSYYSDNNSLEGHYVTYIILDLNADDEIYFRLRGIDYDSIMSTLYCRYDVPQTYIHNHIICKYIWLDNVTHRSLCLCGYSEINNHVALSHSAYCLHCKGIYNFGFMPGPNIGFNSTNDEEEE